MFPAGRVSRILMELPLDMRALDKCAGGEGLVRFRSVPAPYQRRPRAASTRLPLRVLSDILVSAMSDMKVSDKCGGT
jgi:hypothetical protein